MSVAFPRDLLERFEMGAPIASGGYGAVFHATHRSLQRRAAVKLLHSEIEHDGEQVRRFVAEARLSAQLTHPNIVHVIDHGMGDDPESPRPWIAYELAAGGSVAKRLEDTGALPPQLAFAIAAQVADALAVAHESGIVHRDVKPENVLEIAAGRFGLIDFGIALWNDANRVRTATGIILATPAYVSPEVVNGQPATGASDMYSLGVMLFQLLSGRCPFASDSLAELLIAHVRDQPPRIGELVDGLPVSADALVSRALAKLPDQRFASAREMAEAIRAVSGELAPSAPAPPGIAARRKSASTRAIGRSSRTIAVGKPGPAGMTAQRATLGAGLALAVLAIGFAARSRTVAPPPAASPTPSAPLVASPMPASNASFRGEAARAYDLVFDDAKFLSIGTHVFSMNPPATEGRDLILACRNRAPSPQVRAAWPKPRHPGSAWVSAWLAAEDAHRAGAHEKEPSLFRDALNSFEPSIDRPVPGENVDSRLMLWARLRDESLGCLALPLAVRIKFAQGLRERPGEAQLEGLLADLSDRVPSCAGLIDQQLARLDFPGYIDVPTTGNGEALEAKDPGPWLNHEYEPNFELDASLPPVGSSPVAPKKEKFWSRLVALHTVRRMRPGAYRMGPHKAINELVNAAGDGFVDLTHDRIRGLRDTLDPAKLRGEERRELSMLLIHARALLPTLIVRETDPDLQHHFTSALARLTFATTSLLAARSADVTERFEKAATGDLLWLRGVFRATQAHAAGKHVDEYRHRGDALIAYEHRYMRELSLGEGPRIQKAWMRLRSRVARSCTPGGWPPGALEEGVRAAAASHMDDALLRKMSDSPTWRDLMQKLEEEVD